MATKGFGAGLYVAQFWLTYLRSADSVLYMGGQLGSSFAAGNDSAAYLCEEPVNANISAVNPNDIDIMGGDVTQATFSFGNAKLAAFTMDIASIDPTLEAMLSNSAVDESENSFFEIFGANTNNSNPVNVGLSLTQRFQPQATGSDGPDKYHTVVIPNALVRVMPTSFQGQTHSPRQIHVVPRMTSYTPTGTAFSDLAVSFYRDRADSYNIISQYPIAWHAFMSNAADTTFNTDYQPTATTITINASPNHFCINGTATALDSIVVASGLATLAAAGSSGDMNVLMYQTEAFTDVV